MGVGGSGSGDVTFAKLQSTKLKKKMAITLKISYDFFLQFFTKYSTHHSLSADIGFKSLSIILFQILHLQNCDFKFQIFQRALTKNNLFLNSHQIIYSLDSYQLIKVSSL